MLLTTQQKQRGMSGDNHAVCFMSAAIQKAQAEQEDSTAVAIAQLREEQEQLRKELSIVNGAIVALRNGDA